MLRPDPEPTLSVVIPAYDEEKYLPDTLEHLARALEPLGLPVETIVADDDSGDATSMVAERAGARVVRCRHRQISRTRNSGAAEARGRYLLFVDADTHVGQTLLARTTAALEAGAVGGGCRMQMDGRVQTSLRLALASWNRLSRFVRWAAGGYFFCRADAFREVGGFPDDLFAAEEIVLSRRLRRWGRGRERDFVILREAAITSARKAHLYSPAEMSRVLWRVVLQPSRLRSRDAVPVWYDGRR